MKENNLLTGTARRLIVGYKVDNICRTEQWLKALNLAVMNQFPEGIRSYEPVNLVSDNGSQPTSQISQFFGEETDICQLR